ncbi:MAG TPA: hypothetical protein VL201_02490 [Patescibacteria group bacterium]|jgi:hypothetical protein|nr:hypothetical protein [Patescibacteria group bacterium]
MIFLFFVFIFVFITNISTYPISHKKLILVPSVSTRTIGDYYENGLTIAFATSVAEVLQQRQSCLVSIVKSTNTKTKGFDTFALAEEINKKNPDLVIFIGLYAQSVEIPSVHFFCYDLGNPLIQYASPAVPMLVKIENAHMQNSKKSFACAARAEKIINTYSVKGLYKSFSVKGIPFLPLKGLVPPAFACEMGIEKPYDWKSSIHDMVNACIAALPI